ncbi:MAG: TIGR04282 family arsenosugar biosynthesis glycosyltransferase [Sulfuricaulis sp.]|uniref:TIGR04282 family arsenosugar biosynthesis glycosyltransferase n=1 Tax=Sulfuricaulis sp. TaxID=2003553 RepID=UPI0025D407F5|nr:TIGR04282 family arsenosugar biosynthesis glycosyltransferase [Sulfuricaulis sp.]MCR4348215.1 TIGR04282 family arsenosugar biosynthesis glycosyltransferase [Sulfuricaulis sp.]
MKQPTLIIFARQPVPGETKTRLQPDYSPEKSAEIAAFMIRATVELAVSAWPGDVMLYAWPGVAHPLFQDIANEFKIGLAPQVEGDLGAKMLDALRAVMKPRGSAAIMGCDVPQCGWDVLDQANDWLARGKSVLGPTEDGGYYFIGLQEARPELFADIPWGSGRVLEMTLSRADKLGLEFELLPKLRDIDTANDLWFIAQKYEPLRRFLEREAPGF